MRGGGEIQGRAEWRFFFGEIIHFHKHFSSNYVPSVVNLAREEEAFAEIEWRLLGMQISRVTCPFKKLTYLFVLEMFL